MKPPRGEDEDWVPEDDAVIGRALRRSGLALVALAAALGLGLLAVRGCRDAPVDHAIESSAPEAVRPVAEAPSADFSEVSEVVGVDFVHTSGGYGQKFLPETMGSGVAILDYDDDGDEDLFFVNGTRWEEAPTEAAEGVPALFENDGRGGFRRVAEETDLGKSIYGTGVAVGDYDNDGDVDLFIAAVGSNRLLRNDDRGRSWEDVTHEAGVAGDEEWSSSSAFFDYDRDGDLDLFVGNYVRWSPKIDLELDYRLTGIGRAYGPPVNYQGTFPDLFRNEGNGRFVDVSAEAGIEVRNSATGQPVAKTLGVSPVDVNGDGFLDLFVANDTVRNFLFLNTGEGGFEEQGEIFGVAYGRDGDATGAMGVDWGHFRNDDELGFLVANFANEMSSLYVSQGDPTLYTDEAIVEGLGAPSRRMLSFGVFFFDYDLDGRLDVLQTNGHLEEEINAVDPSQSYRQPLQLFWNAGEDGLVPLSDESLGAMATPLVGRASAYGDLDGDGDLDVVVSQAGGAARVFRNGQSEGHHWLRVKLVGNATSSNRDAIGSLVELDLGEEVMRRGVMPTRSYQAQVELPVTFGLGDHVDVGPLRVLWPDGTRSEVAVEAVDRLMVIEQQSGG